MAIRIPSEHHAFYVWHGLSHPETQQPLFHRDLLSLTATCDITLISLLGKFRHFLLKREGL